METRRRASSLVGHLPQETQQEQSDKVVSEYTNASWVHMKGAWLIHGFVICMLLLLLNSITVLTPEMCWTLTNVSYVVGSFIIFHYVTGVPFDFNVNASGVLDDLTLWEQIDNGDQYTPTKKFLVGVPIILFLISTHFTHYDLTMFIINLGACLLAVIPKLPQSHRLRFLVHDEGVPSQTPSFVHLPIEDRDK